jgi:hypothetical protein
MQGGREFQGQRSLAVPRFRHATDLCHQIHHPWKYHSKIFICSGDTGRKGISGSRSLRKGHSVTIPPRDTPPATHHPCNDQSKICIRSGDTDRKGISGSNITGSGPKVTAPRFHHATHLCPISTDANPKSSFVQEIQSGRDDAKNQHWFFNYE